MTTSGRARTGAQRTGDAAEAYVARLLTAAGWAMLGHQVRVGRMELDLVAVDPGPPAALVVVEVRWRRRRDFGLPEETVDRRKRARLRAAALGLVARGLLPDRTRLPALPMRIDLVAVEPPTGTGRTPRTRHYRFLGDD